MHEVIPFEKLIKPDPRNRGFVGPITTDKLQELFRDWQLRQGVPEDLARQIEVARKLFVYGYFVYEFYTIASFISILAVESALIRRFSSYYDNTFEMTKKAQRTTARTFHGVRLMIRKGWRIADAPDFRGGFKSLLLWAGQKHLLDNAEVHADALPAIRADFAHPLFQSVDSIGGAHTIVATSIEIINELFAAHD